MVQGGRGPVLLYLYDFLGRQVLKVERPEAEEGAVSMTIETGGLAAGSYEVVVQRGEAYETGRLVLLR
jgi:hypothetical protein